MLHLLGDQGPSSPTPGSFIRFIYNRVILENAPVRASAVSALAKFAARCEELRPSIVPLLQRCLDDDDDEVRDRATMFLRLLGGSTQLVSSVPGAVATSRPESAAAPPVDAGVSKSLTSGRLPLPVSALQKALSLYQLRPAAGAFAFSALPHVEIPAAADASGGPADISDGFGYNSEIRAAESASSKVKGSSAAKAAAAAAPSGGSGEGGAGGSGDKGDKGGASGSSGSSSAAEALYRIPEFGALGTLFRSTKAVDLTEAELEYLVSAQKHIFESECEVRLTAACACAR